MGYKMPESFYPIPQLADFSPLFVVIVVVLVSAGEIERLGLIPLAAGRVPIRKVVVNLKDETQRVEVDHGIRVPARVLLEVLVVGAVGIMGVLEIPDQDRLVARGIAENLHQLVFS